VTKTRWAELSSRAAALARFNPSLETAYKQLRLINTTYYGK
jgi:hypothetical protein